MKSVPAEVWQELRGSLGNYAAERTPPRRSPRGSPGCPVQRAKPFSAVPCSGQSRQETRPGPSALQTSAKHSCFPEPFARAPSPPAPRTSPPRRGPSAQRQSRAAAAAPSSSPSSAAGASSAGRACSESAQNCSPTARRQPSTAAIARGPARGEERAGHGGRSRCSGALSPPPSPWWEETDGGWMPRLRPGLIRGSAWRNLRGAVRTRGGSVRCHGVAAGRAAAGAVPLRARSAPRSGHRAGPGPAALRSDGGWGKRGARGARV